MENKEAVIKALNEGKTLTSNVTGLQYSHIDGALHCRNTGKAEWRPSELRFDNPPSWLNLRD